MKTEVVMPQMGESVAEGTLTQWLKEIGDFVERDEPLFEITTDKVDAEIPSPVAGVLVECKVQPGTTVEINTIVAIIDTQAAPGSVSKDDVAPSAPAPAAPVAASIQAVEAKECPLKKSGEVDMSLATREELRRTRSTPLVRRIAEDYAIEDLSQIPGTGLSGRVTKNDILQFIDEGKHKQPAQSTNVAKRAPQHVNVPVYDVDRVEPMTPQRLAIAEHMVRSRATSAHAHTVHEMDFSNVNKHLKALKASYAERGVKLTYTAFMMKAVADALQKYPVVNSSMDGNNIVYRGEINVGMAVALDNSLIVPVIKRADELSLLGLARAVSDLAERARTKKLKPEDVQGGTFTLSNHGIFGPEFGIPVINQPQTAIVGTGAIKKRVCVDPATDGIVVRPTCIWCLSFDHRVIDGATADKFMQSIRDTLETGTFS